MRPSFPVLPATPVPQVFCMRTSTFSLCRYLTTTTHPHTPLFSCPPCHTCASGSPHAALHALAASTAPQPAQSLGCQTSPYCM
eukprot:490789-Pelagomonas_calceolata.AAC.1